MTDVSTEVLERAARIRMILLDVDGVLTDGSIHLGSDGEEARSFFVRDGLGIRLAQKAGLTFGIVSGRRSTVVEQRAAELEITEVHQRILDKAGCVRDLLRRLELPADELCFIGDDLIDVPAMRLVGLSAAPADADPTVLETAHYVAGLNGGRGAVREVIDLVLRATGKWDGVIRRFTNC